MGKVVSVMAKPFRAILGLLLKVLRPLRFVGRPFGALARLRGRKRAFALAAAVIVVVALVVVLKPQADAENEVRDTLDRYAAATRDKDYQELCDDLYAADLVDRIRAAGLPCEVALRTGLEDRQNPQLAVLTVEVTGDQAAARVRSTAQGEVPSVDTVGLKKEDGGWKVASLSDAGAAAP